MAKTRPTLGYASREDAIEALSKAGLGPTDIAAKIGSTRKTVSTFLAILRKKGRISAVRRPHDLAPVTRCTVVLAGDVIEELAPHAWRRAITVQNLVLRIVEAAIRDDLVDAVLDDIDAKVAEAA